MDEQWRCKRCETYNDERDEKCVICGFRHSDQLEAVEVPVAFDDVEISSAPELSVIPPVKKKRNRFGIFLALLASLAVLFGSISSESPDSVFFASIVPLILMWMWALKKK